MQGGTLEVGDEEQQEVLMAEAAEEPAVGVHEEAVVGLADADQRVPGAHEPRAGGPRPEPGIAIAVVAEPPLELGQVALRIGQLRGVARFVADRHADQVRPRQGVHILHGEERHVRHAVVLELPIAHEPAPVAVMRDQRREQELPVRRHRRGAMLAHERQILLALLVVGAGENLAFGHSHSTSHGQWPPRLSGSQ